MSVATAGLLSGAPAGWRAEALRFPLRFAPEIPHRGVEQLTFAPGMFQPGSPTYFTYAFLWWLERAPTIEPPALEGDLRRYFAGLYRAVSKRRTAPAGAFSARLEGETATEDHHAGETLWRGVVECVDAFVTEAPLTLNALISRWVCPPLGRTAVFVRLSPAPYGAPAWDALATIRPAACSCRLRA